MVINPLPCRFKILPLQLTEAMTDYEQLCKVTKRLNDVIEIVNNHTETIDIHSAQIKELQDLTAYLQGELEKIANGEYMDIYIEALAKWIDNNLQEIVAKIVKQAFFGLGTPNTPSEGHFVAWIPESWSDIEFDTIMRCGDLNYGHLVLRY